MGFGVKAPGVTRELGALVAATTLAALASLAASLLVWPLGVAVSGPIGGYPGLLFWVALTLVTTAAPVHVPRGPFVSVYFAPILAVALLGGPSAAAVVAVLGTFEVRELRRAVPWWGVLYNHSFVVLPAVIAGIIVQLPADGLATVTTLIGVLAAGVVFFFLTETLTAVAVSIREQRGLRAVLSANIRSYGLTMLGLTPIAWLMALAYVFIGPLVALRVRAAALHDARRLQGGRRRPQHVHPDRPRSRLGHRRPRSEHASATRSTSPASRSRSARSWGSVNPSSSSSSGRACSTTSARSASATPSS